MATAAAISTDQVVEEIDDGVELAVGIGSVRCFSTRCAPYGSPGTLQGMEIRTATRATPRGRTLGLVALLFGSAGCDAAKVVELEKKVTDLEAKVDRLAQRVEQKPSLEPAAAASGTAANDTTPPVTPSTNSSATRTKTSEKCSDPEKAPRDPPSAFLPPQKGNQAQGFDISQAQHEVPWKSLSETQAAFVYIRASQGTNITDREFERNWEMSKHCGFPRGAYHVYDPLQDPDAQAKHFLDMLGDDLGELPPVLDVEYHKSWAKGRPFPDADAYLAGLVKMAKRLEEKTGWTPMIYIQPWYWNAYLGGSAEMTKYVLWAAGTAPRASKGWSWTFWQHGPHMHWDDREWDHDVFYGSTETLQAFIESKGRKGAPTSGGT